MKTENFFRSPKDLEEYVQYVYSTLLNLRDEGVVVSQNAILVGKSGARHEIDVFYQFERSGITHKVAFECKYLKRKVEKSDVIDFHGKVQDIGNVQGIMISKNGYQAGASEYGKHYGIKLLGIDDLPTLNILIAKRITSVALPDETYIGEPFWVIMTCENGKLTGDYWVIKKRKLLHSENHMPLFISKSDAEEFLSSIPDYNNYVVRGLPQHSLKFLLSCAEMGKGRHKFSIILGGKVEGTFWPGSQVSIDELKKRFLIRKA